MKNKLALMEEIERMNDARRSISNEEQEDRQTAVEYSAMEDMMSLYIQ